MFSTQPRTAYEAKKIERELKRHPAYYPLLIQWSQYFMEKLIEMGIIDLEDDKPKYNEDGYRIQNKKMGSLTRNENIMWETIKKYPALQWVDYMAKYNPYVNCHYYSSPENEKVSFTEDSPYELRYLDLEYIKQNPHLNWDYHMIIRKIPGITQSFILEHSEDLQLDDHSDYPFEHEELTWEFLEANKDKIPQVSSQVLSMNPTLTVEKVKEHPEIPWIWMHVSSNPGIHLEDILQNPELSWNQGWISNNPNIKISMIFEYPQIKWSLGSISKNPSITWDDLMKYPGLELNQYLIWLNPNINFDIIMSNPKRFPLGTDPYVKEYLCQNDFTLMRVLWIMDKMKSYKTALHREMIIESWHYDRALDWNV